MYESDFIFPVLLQIAIERESRLIPYFSSVRHQLAVAFLAAQESSPAHSLVLKGFQSRLVLFLRSYCKLSVGVSSSVHINSQLVTDETLFFGKTGKLFINFQDKKKTRGRKDVNKTLIKVIKRKDTEATANAKSQSACKPKQAMPFSTEKIERRSRRELADTISNWIYERRENNRIEKIAAIRKMFGNKPLLSEI